MRVQSTGILPTSVGWIGTKSSIFLVPNVMTVMKAVMKKKLMAQKVRQTNSSN